MHTPRSIQRAFTLVEILIVVVILGILAAIVVPKFTGATQDARIGAFISSLKTYADACEYYNAREGRYPSDGSSGIAPAGMGSYIDTQEFAIATPLGGVWDIEYNDSGVTSAIGVHFFNSPNPGDAIMLDVDEIFDNADLSSGSFQKIASDRYYYILAN